MKYSFLLLLVVLVSFKALNSNQVSTNASSSHLAESLPSLKLLNAQKQVINISSLKGKKVFVNLWATWCGPCRAEIPSIEKLAAKLDPNKVAFVMIGLDDEFAKPFAYATKNKIKLPVFYPAENLPAVFNTDAIPATFIFNEKGELIHKQIGSVDYNTKEYLTLLSK